MSNCHGHVSLLYWFRNRRSINKIHPLQLRVTITVTRKFTLTCPVGVFNTTIAYISLQDQLSQRGSMFHTFNKCKKTPSNKPISKVRLHSPYPPPPLPLLSARLIAYVTFVRTGKLFCPKFVVHFIIASVST